VSPKTAPLPPRCTVVSRAQEQFWRLTDSIQRSMHVLMMLAVCVRLGEMSAAQVSRAHATVRRWPPRSHRTEGASGLRGSAALRHRARPPQVALQQPAPPHAMPSPA
jgi:hypothetical protein